MRPHAGAVLLLVALLPAEVRAVSILGPRADLPTPAGPRSVVVGDFDGDGRNDLAVACASGDKVAVFFGVGGGAFAPRVDYDFGPAPSSLGVVDWNHDGKADLAIGFGGASPQVALRFGDAARLLPAGPSAAIAGRCVGLRFGDFTGDGIVDIAGAIDQPPACAFLLPGNAQGGLGALVPLAPADDPAAICTAVGAGDLDGNRIADLVVLRRCDTCSSLVYFGFPGPRGSLSHIPHPSDVAVIDYNLDGRNDVVVACTADDSTRGQLQLTLGSPTGLRTDRTVDLPAVPSGMTTADFDSSGSTDVAVAERGANAVSLVRFDCNGGVSEIQSYDTGLGPVAVASGDLDGDGRPDLVSANQDGGSISIRFAVATAPRCQSSVSVLTPAITFPQAPQFVTSTAKARLSSGGPAPLRLTGWSIDSPEFTLPFPLPVSIPPGTTADITVKYLRNEIGLASGTLTIGTDDPLHPAVSVELSGAAGVGPQIAIDPPAPPPILQSGQTTTFRVRVHNPGQNTLSVGTSLDSIRVTGAPIVPGSAGTAVALPRDVLDATGFRWDIQSNGSIGVGSDGAFSGGLAQIGFDGPGTGILEDGNRTTTVRPASVFQELLLERQVFVSPASGFARWLEIVGNPTSETRTYQLDVLTNFGGPLVPPLPGIGWAVFSDADETGGRPAVAQVYGATRVPDSVLLYQNPPQSRFGWDLVVGPRGQAAVAHYAVQAGTTGAAAATAQQLVLLRGGALDALSSTERRLLAGGLPTEVFGNTTQSFTVASGGFRDVDIILGATMFLGLPADAAGVLRFASNDPDHGLISIPVSFHVVALADTAGTTVAAPAAPIPPGALALRGLVPNPVSAMRGGILAMSLVSDAPATCAIYDVRGRLLWRREIEGARPGPTSIRFAPGEIRGRGVVWIRLEQGGEVVTHKGLLLP